MDILVPTMPAWIWISADLSRKNGFEMVGLDFRYVITTVIHQSGVEFIVVDIYWAL